MRKTKVKDKSEKSFDSFFENDDPEENKSLAFANNSNLLTFESGKNCTNKIKPFLNFLKQILLFPPGAILLFFVGFVSAIILMDIFIFLRPLDSLPPSASSQVILLGIMGFAGTFMTWFGLGDIKNKKHLSIPASIIFTGIIISAIVRTIDVFFGGRILEEFDKYFIYLLPLILIVPVLMKGWFDKKTE